MPTTVPASEPATRPDGPAFRPNCFNNSLQNAKNNPPAESEWLDCHGYRKLFADEPSTHADLKTGRPSMMCSLGGKSPTKQTNTMNRTGTFNTGVVSFWLMVFFHSGWSFITRQDAEDVGLPRLINSLRVRMDAITAWAI